MRILWLSPTPSHPQNAGNRSHIFALGRQIVSAGHDVHFMLYGQEQTTPASIDEMKAFWSHFYFVPHRQTARKKSQGQHWGIDDWFNYDIEGAIGFLKNQQHFDVVICEYVFLSKAFTLFDKSTFKILNSHDRMSGRAEMLEKNGIEPDFFYTTPQEEAKALDRADLILAIQSEEKLYFESLTKRCVIEINSPIERNIVKSCQCKLPLKIGYLGSNNSLNRKSVQSFLDRLEENSQLNKNVQFLLAGSICNGIQNANIKKLGFVEREEDFFTEIDLFVNPMLDGTGLKIKTLSAFRHGAPFLATEAASAGIPTSSTAHRSKNIDEILYNLECIVKSPDQELQKLRNASLEILDSYEKKQAIQLNSLLKAIRSKNVRHVRKKRILLLTDIAFWEPGVGSHARIISLIAALGKVFFVDVFFLGSIWKQREDAIRSAGLRAQFFSYKDWEKDGASYNFSTPFETPNLKQWTVHSFAKALQAFLASRDEYDVAIIEYIKLAYLRFAFSHRVLTILDTHDLMALREWRFATQGERPSISISFGEELKILDTFHAVIAIQSEEVKWLEALLQYAIPLCCPHASEPHLICVSNIGPKNPYSFLKNNLKIGFVGANSDANVAAIRWFITQVWPVIQDEAVELHVYGSVCDKVDSINKKIVLHGILPSLTIAYEECEIIVNPIYFGGGIKIKSIEALAHGKPLVSSPEGAVGIDNPEESGCIVANTRQDFINALLQLINDEALREKKSIDALAAAGKQFSLSRCFHPLIELIRQT